jgi:large repetitive protein
VTQVYQADGGGGSAATATLDVPVVGVVIDGQGGDDILMGTDADDTLIGGDGDDRLYGNAGDDRLEGGDGLDILVGGPGDDLLIGGAGADTFVWRAEDIGLTPATDVIQDFSRAEGDALDLADLLAGVADDDLTDYLHFESSGADAVVKLSTSGAFAAGFQDSAVDQTIVLRGVSLADLGATDQDIIDSLLASNSLITNG